MRGVTSLVLLAVCAAGGACVGDGLDQDLGGRDAAVEFDLGASADAGPSDAASGPDGGPDDARPPPPRCGGGAVTRHFDLAYAQRPGAPPEQTTLDLAVPSVPAECPAPPLVVYVHGGGWWTGDKRNHAEQLASAFNPEGFAFASVNHRLSPAELSDDPDRIKYPDHPNDVAAAMAWLLDRADRFGFSPEGVRLVGFSAGAGIAAAVATNPRFLRDVGLSRADIAGVVTLDTEAYDIARSAQQPGLGALYRNAFGSDPEVWDEASPITHIEPGADIPPFLVVTRGSPSRIALSEAFAEALRNAGIDAHVLELTDLEHGEVVRALGADDDIRLTPAVLGLFDDGQMSRDWRATAEFESMRYAWSFRAGDAVQPGQSAHGTEINHIVPYDGMLFATLSQWNLEERADAPRTGPSVLVKRSAQAPWEVELTFGPSFLRSEVMGVLRFEVDGDGQPLQPPVKLLVAGAGRLAPREATLWVRRSDGTAWDRILLDANPERGDGGRQSGVRSLAVHRDPVTGVDYVFVGTSAGRVFRGVYDPQSTGSLRFEAQPVVTDRPGRVHALATVNDELHVSTGVDPQLEGGGLWARRNGLDVDFPTFGQRYRLTYVWDNPDPRTSRGLRAITPLARRGGGEVVLGAREQPGVIERIDPSTGYRAVPELDFRSYFLRRWGELGGAATLAAYNAFTEVEHPDSGDRVRLVGLWVNHPERDQPPHNGAYLLIRYDDGTYRSARVQVDADPVPAGRELRGARTIAVSPFAEHAGRVVYIGGFDAAGGPFWDTAWIVKGTLP